MRRARGFSLVELMVAMTLGLLVIAAASSVFVGARNAYTATNSVSAQSDSARFAADFITRALRSSGFIGCAESQHVFGMFNTYSVLDGFAGNNIGGNIVEGFEASGSHPGQTITLPSAVSADNTASDWTPNLPSGSTYGLLGTSTGNVVSGSDILVTYSTQNLPPISATSISSSSITATLPTGYTNLAQLLPVGSAAVLSDCTKGYAFQVTAVSSASPYTISHTATSAMTMGNATGSALFIMGSGFVYLPTTSIYYIALGTDGDGALWRSDLTLQSGGGGIFQMSPVELVPDIENMQILYGIDPNLTHGATEYVRADQVTSSCTDGTWNCVVSVSVALLVSSPIGATQKPASSNPLSYSLLGTTITEPIDTRQRHVYQFTVALRDTLP